jgi:lipoprotein-anchoring transpeptidase ErfK/SrfK
MQRPPAPPKNAKLAPPPGATVRPTSGPAGRARPDGATSGSGVRTWLASLGGFAVAAMVAGTVTWSTGTSSVGCSSEDSSDEAASRSSFVPSDDATSAPADPAEPTPEVAPEAAESAAAPSAEDERQKPWDGPWLGVMAFQTPVYPEMRFGDKRIGYVRKGGKVPVDPEPVKRPNCKQGWYRLIDGGYICGKYATTNLEDPKVRLGVTPPDLDGIVPYKYAYNRKHGTPLYNSLPTREDMLKYEPYLEQEKAEKAAKKAAAEKAKQAKAAEEASEASGKSAKRRPDDASDADEPTKKPSSKSAKRAPADAAEEDLARVPGGVGGGSAEDNLANIDPGADEAEEPEQPWWQKAPEAKDVDVTLAELEADADGNLAKRMVKGFFIAVDKSFGWNDRLWYKTTSGLVAPSDRMYLNKPPETHGTAWPEGAKQVGFITAGKATRYKVDEGAGKATVGEKIERFSSFGLTGKKTTIDGTVYRETTDGWWMKGSQGTFTEPSPRPNDVGEKEKWIDVNLTQRTLVAFEGDTPVYAALVSPGKRSRNKKKDHRTPTGKWRIREKHVAVTMDGDGASGDLPYSIEDVPYVAYFKGSYALHGAFWHNNFGYEMSHGCVNLAPLDAKQIFNWAEPVLPRGWHAVWATDEHPGSMVVVHE